MAKIMKKNMLNVENLYILKLSVISNVDESNSRVKWEWDGEYYIAARAVFKNSDAEEFNEIFSNNKYKIVRNTEDLQSGKLAVSGAVPITVYMNKIDDKISVEELENILKTLNGMQTQQLDYFLQSILIVNSKILSSNMSSSKKEEYKERLLSLSDEYLSSLISLKDGLYNESNNNITIAKIRERFFRKLVEIESQVNIYIIKTEELFDAREEMKRLLKRND